MSICDGVEDRQGDGASESDRSNNDPVVVAVQWLRREELEFDAWGQKSVCLLCEWIVLMVSFQRGG
jgi:hypothetical protein